MTDGKEPYEQTIRNAQKLLDPDYPPRSLFIGVTYDNGSDFIYRHRDEAERPDLDLLEVLAVHLNAAASVTDKTPAEMASAAVSVANNQETLGGDSDA